MKDSTNNQKNTQDTESPKCQETVNLPRDKKRGLTMLLILFVAVVVVSSVSIAISNIMQYNRLMTEKEKLERENQQLEQEIDRLRFLVDSPVNYDYIVREAHRMGMYFPNEKVGYTDGN